LKKLWRFLKKL
nr:Chain A, Lt-MAP4 peptide [Lachesana tarabaevi]